jgi:hypothetical protein
VRKKSSNLVDMRAERAAKRGPPASKWQNGLRKQVRRRPLKRHDFRLISVFRFSLLLFEHDRFRKPVSTFRDHALAPAPQRAVYHNERGRADAHKLRRGAPCTQPCTQMSRFCHIMLPHFHG